MESFGILQIIQRWKDNEKIVGYCHDNDGKARNIIESFTQLQEHIDGGHSSKSITSKFDKVNAEYQGILSDYKESLISFMKKT